MKLIWGGTSKKHFDVKTQVLCFFFNVWIVCLDVPQRIWTSKKKFGVFGVWSLDVQKNISTSKMFCPLGQRDSMIQKLIRHGGGHFEEVGGS